MNRLGASGYQYAPSGTPTQQKRQLESPEVTEPQPRHKRNYDSPATARPPIPRKYDSPATAGPPTQRKYDSPATAGPPMQHHYQYDPNPASAPHRQQQQSPYDSHPTSSSYQYTSSSPPRKHHKTRHDTHTTTVINIKKANLNKKGFKDLQDWLKDPKHVYIGRNMTHYVPGAVGSKWGNPFNAKKFGRDECCKMYRDHVLNDRKLMNDLWELQGKVLGCWCHPEMCHGHVLAELIQEYC